MIIDARNQFCDKTALSTAATGLALIGDQIDMFAPSGNHRDVGGADEIYFVVVVTTAVTSAGAATVSFILASDAQAAIAVDGSATVHYQSAAIPKATLVAGYQIAVEMPREYPTYERYLGVLQNVGTAALTAGAVSAFLTPNLGGKPAWQAYPDAVN